MIIPLANPLVILLEEAAKKARAAHRAVALDDLIAALGESRSFVGNLAGATFPPHAWQPPKETAAAVDLHVWSEGEDVAIDRECQRLLLEGAKAVLLGPYEPRHLAEAIGAAAELHPERFTRFGFDARAWRRALQVRIEDH